VLNKGVITTCINKIVLKKNENYIIKNWHKSLSIYLLKVNGKWEMYIKIMDPFVNNCVDKVRKEIDRC
jgi:hypothetical protein